MKSFTISVHPASLWRVRVVVHPTREAMRQHRAKMPRGRYAECDAFCYQLGTHERFIKDLIAELHFFKPVRRAVVIHECAHAAVAWATHCALDLGNGWGDEHFAQCVEHLIEQTLHGIKS